MKRFWVVAYDISDDAVRHLICEILKDCGQRVQYSVFECLLTRREAKMVRESVKKHLEEGDQVRWYPLCSWCREKVFWQGQGAMPEDTGFTLL